MFTVSVVILAFFNEIFLPAVSMYDLAAVYYM